MSQFIGSARRGTRHSLLIGSLLAGSLFLAGCGGSPQARLDAARQAFQKQNYQSAEVQLKSLLQKQGSDGQAWLLLGRVSLAQGDYDDAIHQFRQAAKAGVPKKDWRVPMAQSLLAENKYDNALTVLGTSDDISADTSARVRADIATLRGLALLGQNKLGPAHDALDQALKLSPKFAPALRARARVALAQKDTTAARADLEQAIAENDRDVAAQSLLGHIDYQNQNCRAAVGPLSAALQKGSGSSLSAQEVRVTRATLADCQFRLGDHDAAEKTIQALLAANSNDPAGNYLQALVDISRGKFQSAANHIQATLNASPDNLRSMTLMAWINLVQGNPDTARPYLDRVLARSPDDALALRLRAGMLIANNKTDQALALVKNAYQQNPDAPGIRDTLASVTAWAHKHQSSASGGEATSNDGNAELQIALARSMMGLDSPAAALAVLDRVKPTTDRIRQQVATARVEILLDSGQTDKAIDAAKKLATSTPSLNTRLLLVRAYMQAGQYKQAQHVIVDIKNANGGTGDERVARLEAALALQQGNDQAAVPILEKLHKAHPTDADIAQQLTSAYLETGQQKQAVNTLAALAKADPDNQAVQQQLARLYLQLGDTKSASSVIQPHLSGQSTDPSWLMLQGLTQLASGATDKGLTTLEKASESSDDPRIALTLAQARLANGRIEPAIKQLQALVERRPTLWAARSLLGEVAVQQGDPSIAKKQASALRSGGQNYAADTLDGDIARKAKDYAKADASYGAAYKAQPSAALAMARFNVRRAGKLDDPAAPLVDWLAKSPSSTAVALQLASWYQAQNEDAQAAKVYRRLISVQPDNPIALNNLAILMSNKDPAQAISDARTAHKAAPDAAAITDTLGWLLWQQGEHEQGLSLLSQAYKAAGNQSPEIAYHYGVARANSPNANGPPARQALETALKGNLDSAEAAHARQLLGASPGSS